MPMSAGQLEQMIRTALPDAEVKIVDLRGDGDHYAAHIVSAAFSGKTRVQQHQLVYDALEGRMGDELHALALQTNTPDTKEPPSKKPPSKEPPSKKEVK